MRNQPLAKVHQLLKGELGMALGPGVAPSGDLNLYITIEQRQQWLAGEYDWKFLEKDMDVPVVAAARYAPMPPDLNQDRPFDVSVLWDEVWLDLHYGISNNEYTYLPSGDGGVPAEPSDPICRWDYHSGIGEEFEVWPIPETAQTVRFRGQRQLASLRNDEVGGFGFLLSARVELDDTLVALAAAVSYMSDKDMPGKELKLSLFQQRLAKLRASEPSRVGNFVIGSAYERLQEQTPAYYPRYKYNEPSAP